MHREGPPILQSRAEEDLLAMLPLKSLTEVPIALFMPLEGPPGWKVTGCLLRAAWTKLWSSALGAGYSTLRGEVRAVHFWHLGCQGQSFTLGDTLRAVWLRIRRTFGLNEQTLVQPPFSPRTRALPSDFKGSSWWQHGLEPFLAVWARWTRSKSASWPSLLKLSTSCVNENWRI